MGGITSKSTNEVNVRITSKGQVTIPMEIREELGLLPETEVQFRVRGKTAIIEKVPGDPARGTRGAALVARLRGSGTVTMSTDEIMALTRGK